MSYGFIITRHVNSEQTNKYWNQCVKLIRTHYPSKKIVIIDDNSNKEFLKPDFDFKNIEIIQSEYPKRGELLPYVYYIKNKWFDNAVIIHDSVFIHKPINFSAIKLPIIPLWHHQYDRENIQNIMRIASYLKNSHSLKEKLKGNDQIQSFGIHNEKFNLCFGGQAFINHTFLLHLENKYRITNMIHAIHCRNDRCALERILGVIFCLEVKPLTKIKSIFGDIFNFPNALKYNYSDYIQDINNKKIPGLFVKVWTGR